MFPFWRPNTAFVATRVCSPGSAALATTSCVAIRPAPSVRTDTLPLSRDLMLYSSGSSVKSVEQPWQPPAQYGPVEYEEFDDRLTVKATVEGGRSITLTQHY